jgi:hypothetical protein
MKTKHAFVTFATMPRCTKHDWEIVAHMGHSEPTPPTRCIRCGDPCPDPVGFVGMQCMSCGGNLCPACEVVAPYRMQEELAFQRASSADWGADGR